MRGGEYQDFPSKVFCLTVPKISVGESFTVAIISGIEKLWIRGRGEYHDFPSKFLSHRTKIFHWGTLRCFRKFGVTQNFMHKKGISLNPVGKFLSHSADKIRRRTLLCFERILVSKLFKQRRGEASRFCRFFLSHRTEKTSPGNHSVFQKISGREKYFMDKRGGITIFRRNFCLTVPKYFIGEHFRISENFFYRKFSCIRGGILVLSKFFVSQDRNGKLCKGTLLFSGSFQVSKKIMDKRGHITIFYIKFVVSQHRKTS